MAVITLVGLPGAPGATSSALALLRTWPLEVEAGVWSLRSATRMAAPCCRALSRARWSPTVGCGI